MTALTLEGLVVGQGRFRVGPLGTTASTGSVLALLGPNGGGKTTLLRTLAGVLPAIQGQVLRPDAAPPALMPAPGEVRAAFPALHMVALGRAARSRWTLGMARADRLAAREAMRALEIESLADQAFDRLSSGQRQLVLLARLMVQDAGLCLLDEPTALLDPGQVEKVQAAIRRLAGQGRVVVVATHDVGAARAADQVLTVSPDPVAGSPLAVLTPERLARLYGMDEPAESVSSSADG
jgi:ABC-type cobalamin/Fe3+-siderophores transport system ATPase subunit